MIEEEFRELLSEMVDALGDAGVDVSYFPSTAEKVLDIFAQKLVDIFHNSRQASKEV